MANVMRGVSTATAARDERVHPKSITRVDKRDVWVEKEDEAMDDRLDTFHIGSWPVIYQICHCHYNLLEPVPLTLETAHLPLPEQR